ncbi:hypothetical protein CCYN2B_60078 [Capnocytophaga cynodegmi]|uniref:Uncharacterized protein n=1 Tax=Capnocytophaga cynodegmi TaxID=28189 RepID=A0A0B7HP73_9FLAO|nr:hypothetical protein CCYN2B_60078 [Capnocytophaga cynodegmi]
MCSFPAKIRSSLTILKAVIVISAETLLPSVADAFMVACCPGLLRTNIFPSSKTLTTSGLLDSHFNFLLVAFSGNTAKYNVAFLPTGNLLWSSNSIRCTRIFFEDTSTVRLFEIFFEVTVIVEVPTDFASMTTIFSLALTVATFAFDEATENSFKFSPLIFISFISPSINLTGDFSESIIVGIGSTGLGSSLSFEQDTIPKTRLRNKNKIFFILLIF